MIYLHIYPRLIFDFSELCDKIQGPEMEEENKTFELFDSLCKVLINFEQISPGISEYMIKEHMIKTWVDRLS